MAATVATQSAASATARVRARVVSSHSRAAGTLAPAGTDPPTQTR